jgi:hypothetical protein
VKAPSVFPNEFCFANKKKYGHHLRWWFTLAYKSTFQDTCTGGWLHAQSSVTIYGPPTRQLGYAMTSVHGYTHKIILQYMAFPWGSLFSRHGALANHKSQVWCLMATILRKCKISPIKHAPTRTQLFFWHDARQICEFELAGIWEVLWGFNLSNLRMSKNYLTFNL